jgi:acetolactate synthase-1/2/3 large subunit
MRTGATSLVETALNAGVEICFANPGTTEMPIVAALDRTPGLRVVLGLFEAVCTGAADGWARMKGKPAATPLHLGPGLANGLANLHNARRARTPVVNWIGNHAIGHIAFDPPLNSDVTALANWVGWARSVRSAEEMAEASLAAIAAAPSPRLEQPPAPAIGEAARRLRGGAAALLLGGGALSARGLRAAARVAAACACPVWIETFPARQECGRHLPHFPALPYFPEQAMQALAGLQSLVRAGARDPVAFFAEPDQPSRFRPEGAALCTLAHPDSAVDAAEALEALTAELGAPVWSPPSREPARISPGDRPAHRRRTVSDPGSTDP